MHSVFSNTYLHSLISYGRILLTSMGEVIHLHLTGKNDTLQHVLYDCSLFPIRYLGFEDSVGPYHRHLYSPVASRGPL